MTDKILGINDILLECAAGEYQYGLITGQYCWSGGDLRGAANQWGARYKASRDHLFARVQASLRRRGWRATLGYVPMGEPRRWRVRLILISPELRRYDQVTGAPVEVTEVPTGLSERPGFELREVAA